MGVMALFATSFFLQNACMCVRMAPGQGHLCHIDTFLVLFMQLFPKILNEMSNSVNPDQTAPLI